MKYFIQNIYAHKMMKCVICAGEPNTGCRRHAQDLTAKS